MMGVYRRENSLGKTTPMRPEPIHIRN